MWHRRDKCAPMASGAPSLRPRTGGRATSIARPRKRTASGIKSRGGAIGIGPPDDGFSLHVLQVHPPSTGIAALVRTMSHNIQQSRYRIVSTANLIRVIL